MKNLPRPNTRLNSRKGKNATQTNAPVTNACSFVNKIKLDSPNKRKKFETSNEDKICRIQHRSKILQDMRDYFKQQKILPNIGEQTQNENSSEISFDNSITLRELIFARRNFREFFFQIFFFISREEIFANQVFRDFWRELIFANEKIQRFWEFLEMNEKLALTF